MKGCSTHPFRQRRHRQLSTPNAWSSSRLALRVRQSSPCSHEGASCQGIDRCTISGGLLRRPSLPRLTRRSQRRSRSDGFDVG